MKYTKKQINDILMQLPGKRGIDIPEKTFDDLHKHASSATMGTWGRHPTPHQLQALYDQGITDRQGVQAAFDNLPHPHEDGMTVGEHRGWSQALSAYKQHK